MAFKISIKPLTFFEIDEAVSWYEKQSIGLGKRFLVEIDSCIEKLKQQPNNYIIIEPPVRRILLKSFPYKLLYFINDEDEVIIIALIHTKRSRKFIEKRISK